MPEICMVVYTYRAYDSLTVAVERAQEFGYDGIELRADFPDVDFGSPAALADSLGRAMRLTSAHGLSIPALFYSSIPVSRDGERLAAEGTFCEALRVVADYGVPILHTRLSVLREDGRGEVVAAGAREDDYRAVQETLARVVRVAESAGVRIALESHMGVIHDTAASQLRIVSTCGSPNLTATLDFANMLIVNPEENLVRAAEAAAGHIGYVHLKNVKLRPGGYDWNLPLRWGDVNYHQVLSAVKETGYEGPMGVEYCGTGDPDVVAEDDIRYLKSLLSRIDY
jgi:sugar phosphate isomerase/epimerase